MDHYEPLLYIFWLSQDNFRSYFDHTSSSVAKLFSITLFHHKKMEGICSIFSKILKSHISILRVTRDGEGGKVTLMHYIKRKNISYSKLHDSIHILNGLCKAN